MSTPQRERMFSREQIREVDRQAVERYGMPSAVLMENAASGMAMHAVHMLGWPNGRGEERVLILCGAGNNGGDGFAAARHLHNAGLAVTAVQMSPTAKYRGDAGTNLEICRAMGLSIIDGSDDPGAALDALPEADLVIDGLLGTGLTREVREPIAGVIEWINRRQDAPVLAVDVPSGMDCDSGRPLGTCVAADVTITFAGYKRGFFEKGAERYTGEVRLVGIGVPRELIEELGEPLPG